MIPAVGLCASGHTAGTPGFYFFFTRFLHVRRHTRSMLALTLVAVGLGVLLAFHWAQRRALRTPPANPAATPPVTILKPLCGLDPELEANLASFFRLDYPCYQLVFGLQDPADPALEVARRVVARFPAVPATIVVSSARVGHNPKVNNLANLLPEARHDLLYISDSNVRLEPAALRRVVAALTPEVGLVTSLIRGRCGQGLGGALEELQLNTFVMGGVALTGRELGQVCAIGKSMLLHRRDLSAIGGFRRLSRFLAEDQVCGQLVAALGRRVVVSPAPVENVLGHLTVRRFAARHLRWARIRFHVNPAAYLAEIATNPVGLGLLACLVAPSWTSSAAALLAWLGVTAVGRSAEALGGVRRSLATSLGLELLRGVLLLLLWPVPLVSNHVAWRHTTFRLGRRTRLLPVAERGSHPRRPRTAAGAAPLTPAAATR